MPFEEKIDLVKKEGKLVMIDSAENIIVTFQETFGSEWELTIKVQNKG